MVALLNHIKSSNVSYFAYFCLFYLGYLKWPNIVLEYTNKCKKKSLCFPNKQFRDKYKKNLLAPNNFQNLL